MAGHLEAGGLRPRMQVALRGRRRPPVAVDDGTVQTLGGPGAASARPEPWYEPGLDPALHDLTEQQRVAVVLCHGFQTHREVAELLELSTSSVQNHVERGLAKLRRALEVNPDA